MKAPKIAKVTTVEIAQDQTVETAAVAFGSVPFVSSEVELTAEEEAAIDAEIELEAQTELEAKLAKIRQDAERAETEARLQSEIDAAKTKLDQARDLYASKVNELKALQVSSSSKTLKGTDEDIKAIRAEFGHNVGKKASFKQFGSDDTLVGVIKAIDYDKRVGMAMYRILTESKQYHKKLSAVTILNDEAAN